MTMKIKKKNGQREEQTDGHMVWVFTRNNALFPTIELYYSLVKKYVVSDSSHIVSILWPRVLNSNIVD